MYKKEILRTIPSPIFSKNSSSSKEYGNTFLLKYGGALPCFHALTDTHRCLPCVIVISPGRKYDIFFGFFRASSRVVRGFISCADVQAEAAAGSVKPCRKACSVRYAGGWPGAWRNPNKRAGISQKDIPAHCLSTVEKLVKASFSLPESYPYLQIHVSISIRTIQISIFQAVVRQ